MRVERGITVAHLLAEPRLQAILRLVEGEEGRDRPVDHPRVQKPGLALAGHTHGVVPTRVQILGETELTFLEGLSPEEQRQGVSALFGLGLSLVVVTRGVNPPTALLEAARETSTPLAVAEPRSSRAIQATHRVLDGVLAPSETRHGVLMDVHGVGTLLLGPSGIGKSECALELVRRGHKLVSDDLVRITSRETGELWGTAPELIRHYMEIRGVGLLYIPDLYGPEAVRQEAPIDLLIHLEEWRETADYERIGLERPLEEIAGVKVPVLVLPLRPAGSMATIVEVAARDTLQRRAGVNAAAKLDARLRAERQT